MELIVAPWLVILIGQSGRYIIDPGGRGQSQETSYPSLFAYSIFLLFHFLYFFLVSPSCFSPPACFTRGGGETAPPPPPTTSKRCHHTSFIGDQTSLYIPQPHIDRPFGQLVRGVVCSGLGHPSRSLAPYFCRLTVAGPQSYLVCCCFYYFDRLRSLFVLIYDWLVHWIIIHENQ